MARTLNRFTSSPDTPQEITFSRFTFELLMEFFCTKCVMNRSCAYTVNDNGWDRSNEWIIQIISLVLSMPFRLDILSSDARVELRIVFLPSFLVLCHRWTGNSLGSATLFREELLGPLTLLFFPPQPLMAKFFYRFAFPWNIDDQKSKIFKTYRE